ncbi:hypothetical protein ACT2FY_39480 [Paraburkholderia fungorum]|uniref:hypothetical protein n=1 Tax=Paraburkholderia fungorum TaxID=134537 RepID=UPI00402BBE1E
MKIKVALIEKEECANGDSKLINLEFYVSSDGNAENKTAFRYTPQGCVKFYGLTPEVAGAFETGKLYFVDLTPAG